MYVRDGPQRRLNAGESMPQNCDFGEDSWESLQGEQTRQSERKSVLNIHWKDWCEAESPILWPTDGKSWLIRKTLVLGKIGGRRRRGRQRDGWMSSLTGWTRVWVDFMRWWWTGKTGVLQSTGSQRVRHDWATEEQQQIVRLRRQLWRSVIPKEIYYFHSRAT